MCVTAECADPTEVGVWWRDDAAWRLYSTHSMRAILQALLHGNSSLQLTHPHPCGASYHIDLVKMQQTNTVSGHKRAIKLNLPSLMHKYPNSNFFNTIEAAGGGDVVDIATARFRMQDSCLLLIHMGDIAKWTVDGKADAVVNPCGRRWGSRGLENMKRSLASASNMEAPAMNNTSAYTYESKGLLTSSDGNRLSAGYQKKQAKGSVATALCNAAGPELWHALQECARFATCRGRSGDAIITQGFKLRASHIIHVIAPKYRGSGHESEVDGDKRYCGLLERTYKGAMAMATANGMRYVAFPAIGCGAGGFPRGVAARVALEGVRSSNKGGVSEIHFVVNKVGEEGLFKEWVMEATRLFGKCEPLQQQ